MGEIVSYAATVESDSRKIQVKTDEMFFYHHGRTPDEFPTLVALAKLLPEINKKEILNIPLTEQEQCAKRIYTENIILNVEPDGTINATDGRHRLLAIKEADIRIPLAVHAWLEIEPIREISDIYEKKRIFFIQKQTHNIPSDIKYFAAEVSETNFRSIIKKDYAIIPLKDTLYEKDYVFIAAKQLSDNREYELTASELKKHNIPIGYTKHDIFGR